MTATDSFCAGCGTALRDASRFCPTCGRPVARAATAAAGKVPVHSATGKTTANPPVGQPPAPAPPPLGAGPTNRNWLRIAALAGLVTAVAVALALVVAGGGSDPAPDGEDDEVAVENEATDGEAEPDTSASSADDEPATPVSTPAEPAPSTSAAPQLPRIDPAWVGIIRSLAVARVPYARAVDEARDLTARGIPAEVLLSSNYGTMNGGYWVVYSGVFSSRDAASSHCQAIQYQLANTCYPREANGYRNVAPPF